MESGPFLFFDMAEAGSFFTVVGIWICGDPGDDRKGVSVLPGVNPSDELQNEEFPAVVDAAVLGVNREEILQEDWKGVGAPISSVLLWGVDLTQDCLEAGAGVFGGGIMALSSVSSSSLGAFLVEVAGSKVTSARDLKQLLSSVSPSEKKLVFAALCEMGEIARRLIRMSPRDPRAASLPIRNCSLSCRPRMLGVFRKESWNSFSSVKSILFKFESSPGERSSIISLPKGVEKVSLRLDMGVIPRTPIDSAGLVMFNARLPPKDLGESKTDFRALERQLADRKSVV